MKNLLGPTVTTPGASSLHCLSFLQHQRTDWLVCQESSAPVTELSTTSLVDVVMSMNSAGSTVGAESFNHSTRCCFLQTLIAKNYLLTWYVHFPFHTGSVVYQRRVQASFDLECGLFGSQTSSWSGLISESWWVDSESPGWRCWWWVLLQQEKMLVPLSSELLLQRDLTT